METTPPTPPASRGGSPGVLATLGFEAGPRLGEALPVTAPVVVIGQGSQADLVLDDDSVSRQHARLEYDAPAWRLTDLESTNGTYVGGVRLAPHVPTPLPTGSSVRFGGVRLCFQAGAPEAVEEARAEYDARPTPTAAPGPRRFRLPVWVAVLVLVLLAALAFLLFGGGAPEPTAPPAGAVSLHAVAPPAPEIP